MGMANGEGKRRSQGRGTWWIDDGKNEEGVESEGCRKECRGAGPNRENRIPTEPEIKFRWKSPNGNGLLRGRGKLIPF